MPCEIKMDGALEAAYANEDFDATINTMNIALLNGKPFFVTTDTQGRRLAVHVPRITTITEVEA